MQIANKTPPWRGPVTPATEISREGARKPHERAWELRGPRYTHGTRRLTIEGEISQIVASRIAGVMHRGQRGDCLPAGRPRGGADGREISVAVETPATYQRQQLRGAFEHAVEMTAAAMRTMRKGGTETRGKDSSKGGGVCDAVSYRRHSDTMVYMFTEGGEGWWSVF